MCHNLKGVDVALEAVLFQSCGLQQPLPLRQALAQLGTILTFLGKLHAGDERTKGRAPRTDFSAMIF
jgi:hypothetical protein